MWRLLEVSVMKKDFRTVTIGTSGESIFKSYTSGERAPFSHTIHSTKLTPWLIEQPLPILSRINPTSHIGTCESVVKFVYKACKLSNETDFLFTKVFIFFKHQYYPLQNSCLGQLHTDGDIVPTFDSNTGSLQPVWSSACTLHMLPSFFIKMSLKGSEKG